ncbi:MAG: efflux transporter outer membrane subunit [Burkholderiaceae bacterium]
MHLFSCFESPRQYLRVAMVACAVGGIAGCASFAGIGPHAMLQEPGSRDTRLTLPDQGGNWPDAQWASEVGGAPLQSLVDEALASNPGIQAAATRVAAAQAGAQAVGAAGLPTVGSAFSATRQRYTENGIIPPPLAGAYKTDSQLALNFQYDFDFWGKNAAALRSALSQRRLAQAEHYNARLIVASAVVRAWLQLGRDNAQLELVAQQIQIREALDRLTRQRLRAGLDTQTETQLSLQQAAGLRAEQAQWQEAIALSRNQLAALLGQGPDRGLIIPRPVMRSFVSPPLLPPSLPLSLIGRRPDIVAARWRVEAMQGQIDYAKAQFYPNVNLAAFAGLSSLGLSNLLESGSRVAGVGPAIRLPIFEGGALRAQLSGQVANYEGAVAGYNQSLTEALHEVANHVQSLRATDLQVQNQQQATEAARRSLALAQRRRNVGTINQLQLLASQSALLTQQRIELDVQAHQLELRVGLIKALGGGFNAAADHLVIAPEQSGTRTIGAIEPAASSNGDASLLVTPPSSDRSAL